MSHARVVRLVVLGVALSASPLAAQQTVPRPAAALTVEDATTLTQGWAYLAQGDLAKAAEKAAAALAASPRGLAALTLSVEVELARVGAIGTLDFYERWLASRTLDEPTVLRRLATALLREFSSDLKNPSARIAALQALAASGDAAAITELSRAAAEGGLAEARVMAATGDQHAINDLAKRLTGEGSDRIGVIEALGESGSPLAVPLLSDRLKDPRPEIRAAAAASLGKVGGPAVAARLRPLLQDAAALVRTSAAGALYALGDDSGRALLVEMTQMEHPVPRRIAAEAMASRPDAAWLALVRSLTTAAEPEIRLTAAKLIAPHDPALARTVLEGLAGDANLTIREMASRTLAADAPGDLRSLRVLLRHSDRLTRAYAGAAILRLTR